MMIAGHQGKASWGMRALRTVTKVTDDWIEIRGTSMNSLGMVETVSVTGRNRG